jgi:glycosyltransferase involved in cell wall biosynthesis
MSKKKLLWIGDCVIPSGFGRVSESILTRIHEEFETTVMGINYFGQGHDFPFTIFPASSRGGSGDPFGFKYIEELFNTIKPDIVVAFNDVWINKFYWDTLKKYKEEKDFKFVVYFPVDGGGWFPSAVNWLNEIDLAITYTNFGVDVMRKAGYTGDICTLEHGIDTDVFQRKNKQQCREIIGKMHKDDFIVFNGNRNQPRKRIDLTIMAFAKFAVDKPNAKLYLHMGTKDVGWDIIPLFNVEMEANGLDPQGRLYLSGLEMTPEKNTITPEVLNIIYNSCDVGINTSEGEGWGLVPFEMAATGCPQVLPNYAASAELFADCGELADICFMGKDVNYGIDRAYVSVDSIVEKLNKLYSDKKYYAQQAKACIAMATDPRFNWDNIAKKMLGYLQSVGE